jgi:hypothetical protein
MPIPIRSAEDAATVDEQFNGFHDGFIAACTVRSRDRFVPDGRGMVAHATTGEFDATLEVAHYNYGGRLQPPERRILLHCEDVRALVLDLREVPAESWPLIALVFVPLDDGSGRFGLDVTRSYLVGGAWETRRERLLTCAAATVEELPDPD